MPTMPNVLGVEIADALTAMVVAGVRVVPLGYFQTDPVVIAWVKSVTAKPGFVTAQSPSAGATMAANAAAILTASVTTMGVANYGGVGS